MPPQAQTTVLHASTKRGLAGVVAAALLVGACGAGPTSKAPRNLILISLDTLRPDHLSCYGHGRETSPAIDALAKLGVRFADASSAAPWTLPSHTTLFTGLYPSHHGVKDYSHQLPAEFTTLAELLSAAGFQTWGVLNTWNIADPRFEIFQGFAREDLRYIKETQATQEGKQVILNTGAQVEAASREFLKRRDPAKPFFLFTHFYDAHTDFTPEPEYRERFVTGTSQLDGTTGQLMAIRNQGIRLAERDLRHLGELYDAEIRQLDDLLGGFFGFLEEEGLLEDTLIVLTSDHGEEFQEHGGLLHGRTQYDELLRVPLILVGPGIPRGVVVEEPVGLVDVLPTVLGRFSMVAPFALDGVDLAPLWTGGSLPERMLFGEADHNNVVDGKPVIDIKRMARLGNEKLHLDRLTDRVQLFDLTTDPDEQRDLASSRPERANLLRAALTGFLDGEVAGKKSGAELTEENLELLRELGYAGSDDE